MDKRLREILAELRGIWRFRWYAILVAWIVAIAGIGLVFALPDVYEARAQVFVDTVDPLMPHMRGGDTVVKVAFVRRLLLSTPNLEQVARDTGLDLRADTPYAFERLVAELQREIVVQPSGGGFAANLYNIVYRDAERYTAERVVKVLLNSFKEQSLDGDLLDDLQALEFLDSQMAEYRRRLEEAENRVADFRRINAGLVGGEGGFFARLDGLREELRTVRTNLRIAQDKRAGLAAQFSAADGGSGHGDSGAATSLGELETQVLQAEKSLDELRLRYTDEHPSVISARETLEALRSRLERRRIDLGPLIGSGAAGAVVENVRISITQAEIEVTEMRGRERDLLQRIDELQQKIDVAPQLEAELAGLNRDHSVLQKQYESLLQRRELLSFDIDRKRQGRQLEFRVIEPPFAPLRPAGPNRVLFLAIVMIGALGTGAAFAFVVHLMRPVFVTGEMIYEQLGVPVLGSVSMAWTKRAMWARRRSELVFAIGVAALLSLFGVVVVTAPQISALAQWLLA